VTLALLALVTLGCGGKGDVSGKVLFKDKPVVWGTVQIISKEGIHQGTIGADGSYTVRRVPVGEYNIAVFSPDPTAPLLTKEGVKPAEGPEEAKRQAALKTRWFPIAQKYGDPDKSGLTLKINWGTNTHDIELK
jgi:hypothetical protein